MRCARAQLATLSQRPVSRVIRAGVRRAQFAWRREANHPIAGSGAQMKCLAGREQVVPGFQMRAPAFRSTPPLTLSQIQSSATNPMKSPRPPIRRASAAPARIRHQFPSFFYYSRPFIDVDASVLRLRLNLRRLLMLQNARSFEYFSKNLVGNI